MKSADIPSFGTTLAHFRKRAGLKNQQQLADLIGKKLRSIAAWEAGEYLPKTRGDVLEVIRKLALNDEESALLLKAAGMDPSPSYWNVPYERNHYFTGRDEYFDQLNQRLTTTEHSVPVEPHRVALTQPQAIKGLGGIGKTQIAVEYAYRSRRSGRYTHTFWVKAESEEMIISSFAAIAELLFLLTTHSESDQRRLVEAVKRWLEQCKERWLLIFDNADDITLVSDYLPKLGNGNILLTTRAQAVGSLPASSIEVDTMGLIEGAHLLLRRAHRFEHVSDEVLNQASNIVAALDYFPLALDQAGAYIEETQCSLGDYLDLYRTHRQVLLAQPGTFFHSHYPKSVATTWLLSFQKIQQVNPAAAELLQLCSFLAPDRIPEELLRDGAAYWPAPLQMAVADSSLFQQLIADLLKFSLIKRLTEDHTLNIHRLVQVVQIEMMERETQRRWAERAIQAINDVFPGNPQDAVTWSQCQRYLEQAQRCYELMEDHELALIAGADVLNRTGFYLYEHALYSIAEQLYERVLAIKERQLRVGSLDSISSLNNLALLQDRQGKDAQAEQLYERALAIREQQLGTEHPDTACSLADLAGLYVKQGKRTQAIPLYERALAIREQRLGAAHPDTARSLFNLAQEYDWQGIKAQKEDERAKQLYERALAIFEQQLEASDSSNIVSRIHQIALLYRCLNKHAQAEALNVIALEIAEKQLGEEHPDTAKSLHDVAGLYADAGQYEQAQLLVQRAFIIRKQLLGLEHPDTAYSIFVLASLSSRQEHVQEAKQLYEQALSIFEQILGVEHSSTQAEGLGYTTFLDTSHLNESIE